MFFSPLKYETTVSAYNMPKDWRISRSLILTVHITNSTTEPLASAESCRLVAVDQFFWEVVGVVMNVDGVLQASFSQAGTTSLQNPAATGRWWPNHRPAEAMIRRCANVSGRRPSISSAPGRQVTGSI